MLELAVNRSGRLLCQVLKLECVFPLLFNRQKVYGPNVIDVPVKSYLALLIDEVGVDEWAPALSQRPERGQWALSHLWEVVVYGGDIAVGVVPLDLSESEAEGINRSEGMLKVQTRLVKPVC